MRLLIVDRPSPLRESLALEFSGREEQRVVSVADGRAEAIELLQHDWFDVVVLAVALPDGSGLDVLAAAKRHPAAPSCIVWTAYGDAETRLDCQRFGADHVIEQSAGQGAVLQVLEQLAKPVGSSRVASG